MSKRRPVVVSLFSGAGGLDYGFEAAGFRTGVAVEMNHDCCDTLRENRRWSVIERSIFEVTTEEMLAAAKCESGELDLLIGGPPCQPFSKAGYWAHGDALRLKDPRANTLSAYLRVVEEAQPRAFLLENVEGLAYAGKDEGLKYLLTELRRINRATGSSYRPVVKVINAADYGVPQLRERLLIVASRDGRELRFPEPTHGPDRKEAHRTAWDALGDDSPACDEDLAVRGKWASLLPSIPEGQNYLFHTDRGGGRPLFGWRRRYWTFLLKLAKNRPSWTIQAQPGPSVGPFHWKSRRLSARELCSLQTFPEDVRIAGGRTSIHRQVGNAVPSLVGEVVGRAIREQLLDLPALRRPLTLLPAVRTPVPDAEDVASVPRSFRPLEGEHSAHPGTGRGNAARSRQLSFAVAS